MTRSSRIRRSQLVTPANRPSAIAKALVSNADCVILDLEDAIPASEKAAARDLLRKGLSGRPIANGTPEVTVRINGLETPWWLDDIEALCGLDIAGLVIPKVRQASDLSCIDHVVRQLATRGLADVGFHPMVETPDGVLAAEAIGRASSRNVTLIFGVGDFMAETGLPLDSAGVVHARARVALAAHACGLQPIDQVWPWVKDLDGLATDARTARDLGYVGKWALHPMQLDPIHAGFAPTDSEVDEARRMLAAYAEAEATGMGAIIVGGQLVDEAVVKIMRNRLAMEAAGR